MKQATIVDYCELQNTALDWGTDLGKHILYYAFRDAVLLYVDKPDFLEAIHDLLRCTPLLSVRARLNKLAEVNERQSERLCLAVILDYDSLYRLIGLSDAYICDCCKPSTKSESGAPAGRLRAKLRCP